MLTDTERIAIAEWAVQNDVVLGVVNTPRPKWRVDVLNDPRAYMPLFERLAEKYGARLMGAPGTTDLRQVTWGMYEAPEEVTGVSSGEAICRAVLALVAEEKGR